VCLKSVSSLCVYRQRWVASCQRAGWLSKRQKQDKAQRAQAAKSLLDRAAFRFLSHSVDASLRVQDEAPLCGEKAEHRIVEVREIVRVSEAAPKSARVHTLPLSSICLWVEPVLPQCQRAADLA
jgi:hypothetical protein